MWGNAPLKLLSQLTSIFSMINSIRWYKVSMSIVVPIANWLQHHRSHPSQLIIRSPFNGLPSIEQTGDRRGNENSRHKPDPTTSGYNQSSSKFSTSKRPRNMATANRSWLQHSSVSKHKSFSIEASRAPDAFFTELEKTDIRPVTLTNCKVKVTESPWSVYHISGDQDWQKEVQTNKQGCSKTAIHELQEKGALKEVNRVDDQYLSTLFILKQGEKNRPVFNLKSLNHVVQLEKLKLKGLEIVRTLLRPRDYMMKLDLQDAYMVPIHEQHKK